MRLLLLLSLMLAGCGQSGELYRPTPPSEPGQVPAPAPPEAGPDEKKKEE